MPTTARQPSSRRERPMAPVVMHYGCGTSRDDLDTGDVKLCTWSFGYEEVDERRPQVAHRRVSCDRLCCGSFPRLCTMCVCAVVCLRDLWIDCMDRSLRRPDGGTRTATTADERQTCRSSAIVLAPRPRRRPVISTSCVSVYSCRKEERLPQPWWGKGENVLKRWGNLSLD